MAGLANFSLDGQVALVTAAARGLGRAICLALAEAGASVALGLRDIDADENLADDIEARGQKVFPLQMDMGDLEEVRDAISRTMEHFGRLDILINNAGVAPTNLALDVREEDFDRTLAITSKAPSLRARQRER